ncbi:MAG: hypothetical protein KC482_06820, partial [Dehalococcoidia bacterium]|nr:hypothetical protein [Dehalococcoidia bacterium]
MPFVSTEKVEQLCQQLYEAAPNYARSIARTVSLQLPNRPGHPPTRSGTMDSVRHLPPAKPSVPTWTLLKRVA